MNLPLVASLAAVAGAAYLFWTRKLRTVSLPNGSRARAADVKGAPGGVNVYAEDGTAHHFQGAYVAPSGDVVQPTATVHTGVREVCPHVMNRPRRPGERVHGATSDTRRVVEVYDCSGRRAWGPFPATDSNVRIARRTVDRLKAKCPGHCR